MRFGRALVDTENDPGTVKFSVNKDAPGVMRVKLIEILKKISYQKVEINVDPSLDADTEDEAADGQSEGTDGSAAQPTRRPRHSRHRRHPWRRRLAPPPVAPPPGAQTAAAPNAGALTAELTALARQIGQVPNLDAAGKANLAKLAGDANAKIKGADLPAAADVIGQLKAGIAAALRATQGSSAPAASASAAAPPAAPPVAPPAASAAAPAAAASPPGAADATALRARLAAAGDRIKSLSPPPAAAVGDLRAAIAAMQGGDAAACAAKLDALEAALSQDESYDPSAGSTAAAFRLAWRDAMAAWDSADGTVGTATGRPRRGFARYRG